MPQGPPISKSSCSFSPLPLNPPYFCSTTQINSLQIRQPTNTLPQSSRRIFNPGTFLFMGLCHAFLDFPHPLPNQKETQKRPSIRTLAKPPTSTRAPVTSHPLVKVTVDHHLHPIQSSRPYLLVVVVVIIVPLRP